MIDEWLCSKQIHRSLAAARLPPFTVGRLVCRPVAHVLSLSLFVLAHVVAVVDVECMAVQDRRWRRVSSCRVLFLCDGDDATANIKPTFMRGKQVAG